MKRIIKFRVWDTKNQKWTDSRKRCCHISYTTENFGLNKRFIFQQFTGVFDINNKEIYEGDIVKTDPNHICLLLRSDDNCPDYTHGEVTWLKQSFKVCQYKVGAAYLGDYSTCNCCPCGFEVIGNIFENPELIKNE